MLEVVSSNHSHQEEAVAPGYDWNNDGVAFVKVQLCCTLHYADPVWNEESYLEREVPHVVEDIVTYWDWVTWHW